MYFPTCSSVNLNLSESFLVVCSKLKYLPSNMQENLKLIKSLKLTKILGKEKKYIWISLEFNFLSSAYHECDKFDEFGVLFSESMFPLFLRLPERKVLDQNGPYLSTNQTKIINVCLSVILEFFLMFFGSIAHPQSAPAFSEA